MNTDLSLSPLTADSFAAAVPELAGLLRRCVLAGASIGFVLPFPEEEAAQFWRGLQAGVETGQRLVLAARSEGRLVGTGQLVFTAMPNGRHRAEIAKLMVDPDYRGRGIARALMRELEAAARTAGLSLLVLDTREGDAGFPLYRSLGFETCGTIPDYARSIEGRLEATVVMYKRLSPQRS